MAKKKRKYHIKVKTTPMDRVYVMCFKLPGEDEWCFKIGKSSGISSVRRLMEIVESIFKVYRFTPIARIARDRITPNAYNKEAELHAYFKKFSYTPKKKFSGSTEFFKGLTEEDITKVYELCLSGKLGKKDDEHLSS